MSSSISDKLVSQRNPGLLAPEFPVASHDPCRNHTRANNIHTHSSLDRGNIQ